MSVDTRSNYANPRSNEVQVEWLQESGYTSSNTTLRDHLWDAINHDSGIVAVPETWAAEKGLPMGSTFPWNPTKKIYFVNAFHGLHCVILHGIPQRHQPIPRPPPYHPLPGPNPSRHPLYRRRHTASNDTPDMRPVTGEGQVRQCRSWDALKAWTMDNPGCYRYGDPNVEDVQESQIPRMRYCEEGNPDLGLIRAYFDKDAEWRPADDRVWSWFDNMDG
ncbi:cytochrome p450 protein [Rutstroemia sp. NJR-2017a BBW]|nr:cytochrome p450 protein [Rutstroemia sp. NJR-2017a BBW]